MPSTVLEAYRAALEEELHECFSAREGFLYNLLRYHLGWVDQQGQPESSPTPQPFHSLLALASCEAWSGDFVPARPAAAAVEFIHNFTLVHDDVQAGRVDAGSRPSIWWVWGPSQAINAGDGLHAMGRAAVMRLTQIGISPDRVLAAVEMLDRSCLSLCEGQYMDLRFQDQLMVTSADYLDMIGRKTGALTGCSAALGALVAGADNSTVGRFRELGSKLGMAWQISGDIADFWGRQGDGVTASNVLSKKKSLPLIYTLENGGTSAKRELGSIYMKRVLEPPDVARIVSIMEESDARSNAEAKASELAEQGQEALTELGITSQRQTGLRQLGQQAVSSPIR